MQVRAGDTQANDMYKCTELYITANDYFLNRCDCDVVDSCVPDGFVFFSRLLPNFFGSEVLKYHKVLAAKTNSVTRS